MRDPQRPASGAARLPYETPILRSYGSASEVTRLVDKVGMQDGGPGSGNMSRTD